MGRCGVDSRKGVVRGWGEGLCVYRIDLDVGLKLYALVSAAPAVGSLPDRDVSSQSCHGVINSAVLLCLAHSFPGSTGISALIMVLPWLRLLSQLGLEDGTSLPGVACLELGPAAYCTWLNAQVSLPAILGLEVTHARDLLFPSIPYGAVWEGISCADQAVLATFFDSDWWDRRCGVDPVCFGGDRNVRRIFGERLCFADFVDVACALEAGDGGFGDVLGEG